MYIPFLKIPGKYSDSIFYWDTDKRLYTFENSQHEIGHISREEVVDIVRAAEIPPSESNEYTKKYHVPESCFEGYSKGFYQFEISGKKIFIFENHASAILAWFHLRQDQKYNLITFDEHTDTLAPLLRYKNSSLEANEEIFISELNHMKNNLTETLLKGLLTPGSYLKGRKRSSYGETLHLWNDEHITTSIFFELIDKAYIVSPEMGDDLRNSKENYLAQIYRQIFYLNGLLKKTDMDEIEDIFEREFRDYQNSNIGNDLIERVMAVIPENEDIILDIDLDYFKDIKVLESNLSNYRSFARLVRRCKGITIATEPNWVADNVGWYNSNVKDKNTETEESEWIWGRYWNAQDCFEKLMIIIQASLDNKI